VVSPCWCIICSIHAAAATYTEEKFLCNGYYFLWPLIINALVSLLLLLQHKWISTTPNTSIFFSPLFFHYFRLSFVKDTSLFTRNFNFYIFIFWFLIMYFLRSHHFALIFVPSYYFLVNSVFDLHLTLIWLFVIFVFLLMLGQGSDWFDFIFV
jgi:hypothetical protein